MQRLRGLSKRIPFPSFHIQKIACGIIHETWVNVSQPSADVWLHYNVGARSAALYESPTESGFCDRDE
jgi:hypothetical protein